MAKPSQPPAKAPSRKLAVKQKIVQSQPLKANASTEDRTASIPVSTDAAFFDVANSPYFRDTLGVKNLVGMSDDGENGEYAYYDRRSKMIVGNKSAKLPAPDPRKTPADNNTAKNILTHEGGHALTDETDEEYEQFPSYAAVRRPRFTTPFSGPFSMVDGKPPAIVTRETSEDQKAGREATTFDRDKNTVAEPIRKPNRFPWYQLDKRTIMKERPMLPSEAKAMGALNKYYAFAAPVNNDYTGKQYIESRPREAFAQAYTNAAGFLSETANDTTDFRNKIGRYEGNTPGAGAIVLDLLKGNPIYKNHPLKSIIR